MTEDAEGREFPGKLVNDGEKQLYDYDGVYEAAQKSLGEDGVFFDEFGQVVQARC